ncbi:MAG: hypothetical protein JWP97_2587 [Labilithrix sp.]|nr:hypothetical protein [Labilithrix sp.]
MVHVRNASRDPEPAVLVPREPRDLVADGESAAVQADTEVATSAAGPFVPLAIALERDGALRDAFAAQIAVPAASSWRLARLVALGLGIAPLLMTLALDRELAAKNLVGAPRLALDALVLAYVVLELTRRTPRLPRVVAAALAATGLRFLLGAARTCGAGVSPAAWGAAALALAAAGVLLVRAPTRGRFSLELLDRLGISRADANDVKRPPPLPDALLVTSIAVAAVLPIASWQLRVHQVAPWQQGIALVLIALIAPALLARQASRSGAPPVREHLPPRAVLHATAAGLVLTASLLYGAHAFFDAGGELARCTHRLDAASQKLLAVEAAEVSRRIALVRGSTALVLLATVVMPFVEERIYRGVLMNALVRRYGSTYGLFASALAFGFTHVGLYEIALYQTVLLGLAFGMAYLEGGLVAAFVVHAAWNLLNVA